MGPSAGVWLISAYCLGAQCGALEHGITTSGTRAEVGRTIACPPELEFGTLVYIKEIGRRICEDRGEAIQGKQIDVFMEDLNKAREWGTRKHRVWILWKPGDLPPWNPNHRE